MIVDSSALIAVLRAEPEADEFAELIVSGPTRISAANWLEASMVAHGERGSAGVALLDRLVEEATIEIEPVRLSRPAGRGWRSNATDGAPARPPGSTSVTVSPTRFRP
ncbi:MAG: type II toxin-antitoxin system VapC family toxin [Micropruina sp.]